MEQFNNEQPLNQTEQGKKVSCEQSDFWGKYNYREPDPEPGPESNPESNQKLPGMMQNSPQAICMGQYGPMQTYLSQQVNMPQQANMLQQTYMPQQQVNISQQTYMPQQQVNMSQQVYGPQSGYIENNSRQGMYPKQPSFQVPNMGQSYYPAQAGYTGQYQDYADTEEFEIPPKKILNRAGLGLFIFAIAMLQVQIFVELYVSNFYPSIEETDWYIWALTALSIVVVGFPIYFIFMKIIPDSPRGNITKLKPTQFFAIFFICVSAMYITNIFSIMLTTAIASLKGDSELFNQAAEAITEGNFALSLIYVSLVAPVVEELVFRKILLNKLRCFGDVPAILISGIAFGLFHMNLSQMFYAAVLGFIFAYVTIKTNTIRYSIVLHMMINFISTMISTVATDDNIIGGLAVILWIGISILLGIVFFILSIKKIKFEKKRAYFKKSWYFFNPGTILFTSVCFVMIVISTIFSEL